VDNEGSLKGARFTNDMTVEKYLVNRLKSGQCNKGKTVQFRDKMYMKKLSSGYSYTRGNLEENKN
jgi:hypothetical protein